MMWIDIIANLGIGVAYLGIPGALGWLYWRHPKMPFGWLVVLFILFITACAGTHFLHVARLRWELNMGALLWDMWCAVISLYTMLLLWGVISTLDQWLRQWEVDGG